MSKARDYSLPKIDKLATLYNKAVAKGDPSTVDLASAAIKSAARAEGAAAEARTLAIMIDVA